VALSEREKMTSGQWYCCIDAQFDAWRALLDIPASETRSCSDPARADGSLTGYGGGLWRKQQPIELERRIAASTLEPSP
jgi:O6-methylguanine-DNA--protein-cysteine methyltransferase